MDNFGGFGLINASASGTNEPEFPVCLPLFLPARLKLQLAAHSAISALTIHVTQ
jgi:hypothetical protein